MKNRALLHNKHRHPTPTLQAATSRYETAKTALADCWNSRPKLSTPERADYETHQLAQARTEAHAAWIEPTNQPGINPDKTSSLDSLVPFIQNGLVHQTPQATTKGPPP